MFFDGADGLFDLEEQRLCCLEDRGEDFVLLVGQVVLLVVQSGNEDGEFHDLVSGVRVVHVQSLEARYANARKVKQIAMEVNSVSSMSMIVNPYTVWCVIVRFLPTKPDPRPACWPRSAEGDEEQNSVTKDVVHLNLLRVWRQ